MRIKEHKVGTRVVLVVKKRRIKEYTVRVNVKEHKEV